MIQVNLTLARSWPQRLALRLRALVSRSVFNLRSFRWPSFCKGSIVFGLVPAVRASRPDVMDLLRRGGRQGNLAGGKWLRIAAVIAEVALSFVLLFLVPDIPLPQAEARHAFQRDFKARLESLPGVTAVTAANPFPLDGRIADARWGTEEAASDAWKFQRLP